jgi:hypothetical protein
MARDFEDVFDLSDMSDDELRSLVRDELSRYDGVDADSVVVQVSDGVVRLSGRVGTDGERQIAEHILTDVIGVDKYQNDIVVDEIRRDQAPEEADDAAAQRAEGSGEPLGRPRSPRDDEDASDEDELESRLYGTHDVSSAIENGTPWVPPEAPTQEGFSGRVGDWDPEDEEEEGERSP